MTSLPPSLPRGMAAAWFACGAFLACTPAAADNSIITDRPDFVESSNVVGAGKVQVEMSAAIERSSAGGERERLSSTPALLRIGVSDNAEIRLETDGRMSRRVTAASATAPHQERGMSDISVGAKWHLADGDAGQPSLGLLAHLDLPSGARAFRAPGLHPSMRLVAEWELPGNMSLGIMPGVRSGRDAQGRRYGAGILGAVLGKSLNSRFRTFIEIALPEITSRRHGGTQAVLNVGGAFLLSNSVQADVALSRGLNRNTYDTGMTIGLSFNY